ncbi:MAG: alpha/beta fold hydrolase [Dokdonella sp.]
MNEADKRSKQPHVRAASIHGTWNGTIQFGEVPIPIVLRCHHSDSQLTATSDFPQQQRIGIVVRELSFEQGTLRFTTRSFGDYAGELSSDGSSIVGAFSQEEKRHPLTLLAGEIEQAKPARPQTPQPPFGYAIEHVQIDNLAAGCTLAGTLTIPTDHMPRAVALLITGSGAMDRDETVFGHKPFWILADHLSRHGYAVLRLDNRGVGESSGDRSTITLADEADDMATAVEYLKHRRDLQCAPIGLIGHSMGALTGMTLAAQRTDIAFLVSMAGPAFTLGEVFAQRECEGLEKSGKDADAITAHRQFTRALYARLRDLPAAELIDAAQVATLAARFGATQTAFAKDSEEWITRFNQAWFRSAVCAEPATHLDQITAPFLAINGSVDVQVPAIPNLAAMNTRLSDAGHSDFDTRELAGLNHLFQTCTTGAVYLYPVIEETFAPSELEIIRAWLDARFPARSP